MLLVADKASLYTVTGAGDVLEPEHGVAAIGSGGQFALAAARAMLETTQLDARNIAERSLNIAADICIYTNRNLTVEELGQDAAATRA
jgi:ATP-dependent HslUV protease subunit HslV